MSSLRPLISIITVVRNGERTIEETLSSVRAQTFRDYEHIVIDGGSTDRTVEVLKSFSDGLAFWSSEPDNGIADAMNKGLARATGIYVLFLHSDDCLVDTECLQRVAASLGGDDIYAFEILMQTSRGVVRRSPRGASWHLRFKTGFLHQGTLCRRSLFDHVGVFDKRYKVAMDYEFFVRAVAAGAKVSVVHEVVSVMRDTGISSRKDWRSLRHRFAEERAIQRQHCANRTMAFVYTGYWLLYLPYRWARSSIEHN